MKLFISRGQDEKKGFFGGSKGMSFKLSCRIELNSEESNLVEKYKQGDAIVYSYENTNHQTISWKLREMQEGKIISCDSVAGVIETEEEMKKVCGAIKNLLLIMASFGGEEVFEY